MTPAVAVAAHQVRAAQRPAGRLEAAAALAVDTANAAPPEMARFRPLNPFTVDRSAPLAVPGRPDLVAHSVEGIWQGLKVLDGRLELPMLLGEPEKRPTEAERASDPDYRYENSRFCLGDRTIDLIAARRSIYLPAYLAMLERRLPADVEAEIVAALRDGRDVVFYDWDDNFNIDDPSGPFSHSAILASWFGGRLEEEMLRPARLRAEDYPRYLAHRLRLR